MRDFSVRVLLVVLLFGVTAPALAQGLKPVEQLRQEWRSVDARHRLASSRRTERLAILKRGIDSGRADTLGWVVSMVRSLRDTEVQRVILQYLAKHRPDEEKVIHLHREFMVRGHAHRQRARDFLLEWALRVGRESWLARLYDQGNTEDRFLAVDALGKIGSKETLPRVQNLLSDSSWQPLPNSVINMSTLARAIARFESETSARLLILIRRDVRFRENDEETVRRATRTWKYADPRRYIHIRGLGDADPERRADLARFFGIARYESARAPLLALARNMSEPVEVRVAATLALGHFRIARAALADDLARLLKDHDARVRRAAVAALAELRVTPAVRALIPLLATELEGEVRKRLSAANDLPESTDWQRWIYGPRCTLPSGE